MDGDGVPFDDMDDQELSDLELDELLAGTASQAHADHPLGQFIASAKTALSDVAPGPPTPALREFLDVKPTPPPIHVAIPTPEVVQLVDIGAAKKRNRKHMIPAFGSFVAFMLCGAYITGIVNVPVLPQIRTFDPVVTASPDGLGVTDEVVTVGEITETSEADEPPSTSAPVVTVPAPVAGVSSSGTTTPTTGNAADSSDDDADDNSGSNDSDDDADDNDDNSGSDNSGSDNSGSDHDDAVDEDDDSSSSSSSTTSTSVDPAVINQSFGYSVPGVASVTVNVVNGFVSITNVSPSAGWVIDEAYTDGIEAQVRFTDGESRVRIDAEVEDGLLRVRLRDERPADRVETESNFSDGTQVGDSVVDEDNSGSGKNDNSDS